MGFDLQKFGAANFKPRTKTVPVPELAAFFGPDETPEWIVRALSASELAQAENEAVMSQDDAVRAAIEGAAADAKGTQASGMVAAILQFFGAEGRVPKTTVRRMAYLRLGSVDPKPDHTDCVRISEQFGVVFLRLTNAIEDLTAQGNEVFQLGESPASGPTRK